jgi:hypothetical protein
MHSDNTIRVALLGVVIAVATLVPLIMLAVSRLQDVDERLQRLAAIEASLEAANATVTLVGSGLVIVNDNTDTPPAPSRTYELTSDCDDGNPCTADYLVTPPAVCVNERLPVNTSCTNTACYRSSIETHCVPKTGTCESTRYRECRGHPVLSGPSETCPDMDVNFDWYSVRVPWLLPLSPFSFPILWADDSSTFYNLCELRVVALDINPNRWMKGNHTTATTVPVPVGLMVEDCRYYVDTTIYARSKDCLIGTRFLLDTNVTRRLVANEVGAPVDFSYQFSICVVRYACAEFDQTTIGQSIPMLVPSVISTAHPSTSAAMRVNPLLQEWRQTAATWQQKRAVSALQVLQYVQADVHAALVSSTANKASMVTLTAAMPPAIRAEYATRLARDIAHVLSSDGQLTGLLP